MKDTLLQITVRPDEPGMVDSMINVFTRRDGSFSAEEWLLPPHEEPVLEKSVTVPTDVGSDISDGHVTWQIIDTIVKLFGYDPDKGTIAYNDVDNDVD